LFCFPYAGTGAAIYREWGAHLPADVEVCPVQLPGRGARAMETPFTRVVPLVQVLAQDLLPLLDKPFVFFGHSLGAIVAFELARELRRQFGVQPCRLFISASRAPQISARHRPIHALPEAEFLDELRRLNGTPAALLDNAEFMRFMLPVLRADFALYETHTYAPEEPLDCVINGFGGIEDRRVDRSELDAWRVQTSASFSLRMLPGDHFYLNAVQPLLLRMLSEDLHGAA